MRPLGFLKYSQVTVTMTFIMPKLLRRETNCLYYAAKMDNAQDIWKQCEASPSNSTCLSDDFCELLF